MNDWRGPQGEAWATRNMVTVEDTDRNWLERFGVEKAVFVRQFLESAGVPAHGPWLEVGCSAGAHMRVMRAAGFPAPVGVDVNHGALRRASGHVTVAEARALPFRRSAFTGVTTSGTLMHVGPPDVLVVALAEFRRVASRWLFFIETHAPEPTYTDYSDLMPPSWTYPWLDFLPPLLPGWRMVDGAALMGRKPNYGTLDAILFRKRN